MVVLSLKGTRRNPEWKMTSGTVGNRGNKRARILGDEGMHQEKEENTEVDMEEEAIKEWEKGPLKRHRSQEETHQSMD